MTWSQNSIIQTETSQRGLNPADLGLSEFKPFLDEELAVSGLNQHSTFKIVHDVGQTDPPETLPVLHGIETRSTDCSQSRSLKRAHDCGRL